MKYVKVAMLVVLATLFVTNIALAELTISANAEFNHDMKMTDTEATDVQTREQSVGGRIAVVFESKKTLDSGFYAKAKGIAQIQLEGDMNMDADQLEIGNTGWYLQLGKVGRIGTDGKGQDIYIVDAPGAPGRYLGHATAERGASLYFKPSDTMLVNMQLDYKGSNELGARPAIQLTAGPATVKLAGEYKMVTPTDTDSDEKATTVGGAANVETAMGAITVGVGLGYKIDQATDAAGVDADDVNLMSGVGYAKIGMGAGTLGLFGGYDLKTQDNVDDVTGMSAYVSYSQGMIGGIDGLKLSFGAGFGSADDGSNTNTAFGGRIRTNYDF